MNKDRKILYAISILIFVLLLAALFVDIGSSRIVTACLLIILTPLTLLIIIKRSSVSINKREVLLVTSVVAVLYVILIQMSGLIFGYYKNPYFVKTEIFLERILPTAVIIVGIEIIRHVLLSQKNKFVNVLAFLSCLIAEMLMFSNLAYITNINRFMDLVGMTLFPAVSANVYYHHVSKNYGSIPNISFRLITTLYVYFMDVSPDISDALHSCIKIISPIIMLAFISALFVKKKKNAHRKGEKLSVVGMVIAVAIVASVAMLISCQFRFGALVIATESMTGEINKGDVIIYERYDDQPIKIGQVVVFMDDGKNRIVHRVVRIENINGEVRYYTKGDFNKTEDSGYRTESDIVGLTDLKIAYIGYPTLWLHELISN